MKEQKATMSNTRGRIGGWIVSGYAQWVTDRAALIDVDAHGKEWIPLSQIRGVMSGTLDPSIVNPKCAEDRHEFHVELAVNPWFVERAGLPHAKPRHPRAA